MTVDELEVLITANTNELRKEMNNANKSISGLKKSAEKGTGGVSTAFKKLKTGIIALGIGKVIKDSIQSGMDAIESDSLFTTVMGDNAEAVKSWSNTVADSLGLSAVSMQKNIGVVYNMTSSMGVAGENALKMSKGVSVLAEDMASFYNLDSAEAFNKLRAGLTGETEPLKALGILVDENTVKQVAYSEGIAENGAELTQQQKVLARYVAILKQTGNAQGDLARTLDSPSNQLRSLKQNVQNLGIAFSKLLMPIVQAVLPWLNALAKVATQAINGLAGLLGVTGDSGASEETKNVSENVGGLSSGLDDATKKAKKLKGSLAGFDEMNVLQDKSSDGADTSSGGSSAVDIGFNLDEYDAHLDWIEGGTNELVEKIKTTFGSVGTVIKDAWNSKPVQAFVGAAKSYGGFLWDYWSTLGGDLVTNVTTTWDNVKGNVETACTNISTLWTNVWTDIQGGIETWGQPIIDGVSNLFNSVWADAIDPYLQLISQMWADFSGILVELWNEHGQPLIDNIGEFIVNVEAWFQCLWDNVLAPIVQPFLEALKNCWEKYISPLIKTVGDFVMSFVNGALEIYNKFISPIIMWIVERLKPTFTFIGNIISTVFQYVVGVVSSVINGIIGFFTGLIDFVVGIFTGNWSKAWDGIKKMFSSVWNSIKNIAGAAWDFIKGVFSSVKQFFVDRWNDIKKVFSGVVTWFGNIFTSAWNGIKNAWSAVKKWFSDLWTGIKNVFASIGTWFGNVFANAWKGIKNAWSAVKTWFSGIWTGIKNVFSSVGTWFGNIFTNAWKGIKNAFSSVGKFFTGIWDNIKKIFSNVGSAIANAVSGTVKKAINTVLSTGVKIINGFISAINLAIGLINMIPGVEIKKLTKLEVPKMAKGGITNGSTLANIGEAGREAVLPLENNLGYLDKFAEKIASKIGGGNGEMKLTVKLGEDTIFDKLIEYGKAKAFETNGGVVFV